jgi:hypothetical protein
MDYWQKNNLADIAPNLLPSKLSEFARMIFGNKSTKPILAKSFSHFFRTLISNTYPSAHQAKNIVSSRTCSPPIRSTLFWQQAQRK